MPGIPTPTGLQVEELIRRILVLETQVRDLKAENRELRAGLRGALMRKTSVAGYDVRRFISNAAIANPPTASIYTQTVLPASEVAIDPQTLRQLWADKERLASIERDRVYALRRRALVYEGRLRQWASVQLRRWRGSVR